VQLRLDSTLHPVGERVIIHDLSTTGFSFQTSVDLAVGQALEVSLPEVGGTGAVVVRRDASLFACAFNKPISQAAVSAALLRSGLGTARASLNGAEGRVQAKTGGRISARSFFSVLGVAGPFVAGSAYLIRTGQWTTLTISAAILIFALVILVRWGCWALNNEKLW